MTAMDKTLMRVERFNPDILSVEEVMPMPQYEKAPAVAAENRVELVRRMEKYAKEDGTTPTIPGISRDGSDITDEEKRIFMLALSTVAGVFAVDDRDLGCTNRIRHNNDTGTALPLKQHAYRPPFKLRQELENLLHETLMQG